MSVLAIYAAMFFGAYLIYLGLARVFRLGLQSGLNKLKTVTFGDESAVTANAVCPGYTETPMLRRTVEGIMGKTGRSRAEAEAPLLAHNPQARFVDPAEVADAVAWLAGDAARSINGQAISVSGGETM